MTKKIKTLRNRISMLPRIKRTKFVTKLGIKATFNDGCSPIVFETMLQDEVENFLLSLGCGSSEYTLQFAKIISSRI